MYVRQLDYEKKIDVFGHKVDLDASKEHNYHDYIKNYDISNLNITNPMVFRNIPVSVLYEEALRYEYGSVVVDTGALAVTSHKYTGRVPKEKRIVKDNNTEHTVHWGDINIPIEQSVFNINRVRALDYLDSRRRIYIVDSFAGWDINHRIKIRTVCSRAYHALFMTNMLIRPSQEELDNFGDPDFTIINSGSFPANRFSVGVTSDASIIINFTQNEMIILGTEYAGEMKKGVFTVINYLMPFKDILPMHCAANVNRGDRKSTLFFGLSGTGKTTLSSDTKRLLVGDDEHCWTDESIFNIEGGCYAKCIDPPETITQCIGFGTLLENITYNDTTREVDFMDESITTNTRAAYPLAMTSNVIFPSVAAVPHNIIFLSCDAFGILPPVARLNNEQAMYHFLSGYTAKTPSTEVGINTPTATFSACFGEVFLPLDPVRYAELFKKKLDKSGAQVWLINTGWIGGAVGIGHRMSLAHTLFIVDSICCGSILKETVTFRKDEIFNFDICTSLEGIDTSLDPREAWEDTDAYDEALCSLFELFQENMRKYFI